MPRTAPITRRAAVLAAAAALLLTGCGGAEETGGDAASPSSSSPAAPSSSSEAPAESPAAAGGTITVTGVDFELELDSTELVAGEYEVDFTNDGSATHALVVERDGEDVAESESIPSGETSTFTVSLKPGEYTFYCPVGNHRSRGMEIPVTVTVG